MRDVVGGNLGSGGDHRFRQWLARLADDVIVDINEVIWLLAVDVLLVSLYVGFSDRFPPFVITT
jgi:hypothetical protein